MSAWEGAEYSQTPGTTAAAQLKTAFSQSSGLQERGQDARHQPTATSKTQDIRILLPPLRVFSSSLLNFDLKMQRI